MATLSGQAESAAAMEKVIQMAGNIQGISEVRTGNLTAPEVTESENVEYYVIKSGDTLSAIAAEYYGKELLYPRIFEANREVIKNLDLICAVTIFKISVFYWELSNWIR